jgi:hypothetical protein
MPVVIMSSTINAMVRKPFAKGRTSVGVLENMTCGNTNRKKMGTNRDEPKIALSRRNILIDRENEATT